MRAISVTLSAAAVIWTGSLVLAQNDKGWIGTTFHPDRCLRIQAGEFEVQRKLCRIKMVIASLSFIAIMGLYDIIIKRFQVTRFLFGLKLK